MLKQNAQQPLAVDLEFDATESWAFALGDPTTFVFNAGVPEGGNLPSPIFDSGLPPFTITAPACPIDWAVAGDTFAASPPENPTCTGPVANITLWPFGVSRAHSFRLAVLGLTVLLLGHEVAYRRVPYFPIRLNQGDLVRLRVEGLRREEALGRS